MKSSQMQWVLKLVSVFCKIKYPTNKNITEGKKVKCKQNPIQTIGRFMQFRQKTNATEIK